MASMLENTPLDLAVDAYLLRAYGFSNKTVYELLGDNGFDVSIYAPAAGSTGGTGDKNLNKQLFIPKTRDRVGGARGSPSWLPAGERMADWLAQQIGFADEPPWRNTPWSRSEASISRPPSPWEVTPPVVPNAT